MTTAEHLGPWEPVLERLFAGEGVDATHGGTHLHLDRPVPFLCVYRAPRGGPDEGTRQLIESEAAHLTVAADEPPEQLTSLLDALVGGLSRRHGGFLLLEVWACDPHPKNTEVRVQYQAECRPQAVLDHLMHALEWSKVGDHALRVKSIPTEMPGPPGAPALLSEGSLRRSGCALFGLEVEAFYRSVANGELYPQVLRELRWLISAALRRGLFEFVREYTDHPIRHHLGLGPHALRDPIMFVDRELAQMERSFDFLLEVTPVNAADAKRQFEESRRERAPMLVYRPCVVDPDLMKRRLYQLPVEDIEDPIMEELCLEKRDELDLKLTMLKQRGRPGFLYASLQLHGAVEPTLLQTANDILARYPQDAPEASHDSVDGEVFAKRARRDCEWFGAQAPEIPVKVELRDDVIGLLVSRNKLLIGEDVRVPANRVEALIAHELETHVLTHVNGTLQPLKLLSVGLVGYDALQEGMGVLAEHLVGGLTVARLRLLAGRVVGANAMMRGATFVETHRLLERDHGFASNTAFWITLRLYRGGGLMKDVVYLRGLLWLMRYLREPAGAMEPLFIGKIAPEHLPVVEELRHRQIVSSPRLFPRYLQLEPSQRRLQRIRHGEVEIHDLVSDAAYGEVV